MTEKKSPELAGLDFGATPPDTTRGSRYEPLYAELRNHPGEWADATDAIRAIATKAESKVPTVQSSAITLRNQGFEATTRKGENGERVYVRYIPEQETAGSKASKASK